MVCKIYSGYATTFSFFSCSNGDEQGLGINCSLYVGGQYLSYTWKWSISESNCHSALNCSGVAVIDGSKVLYTPFRYAIIPPPVSASELLLPAQVSELAFSPLPNCNDFLAVLSDFRIAVFAVLCHSGGAGEVPGGVVPLPVPELVGIARYVEAC